jgi:methionyl-tRNA synthetase
MKKFYITTSIAYVNAQPHIGFALELLQADVLARYNQLAGKDVYFLTGTDEHGSKIEKAAKNAGLEPQVFTDNISEKFQELTKKLQVLNDDFIRTTDEKKHIPAVLKLWNKLVENGDLYKKDYEGLYCIGHEAFIKKSELVDGKCPMHKTEPEVVKEENWFFKITKYKKQIRHAFEKGDIKIIPQTRTSELLNLLDDAEDVSFSRPSKDLKWGIPVPGDDTQTMYVWADALTNYISAIDYATDGEKFKKYWPADVHLVGKDILRFHAMIWPAMLLSAGLELPKNIYVHGFVTVEGEKMSKSLGNVIDPFALIEKYGLDPVRYFLLRELPSSEDGDFSYKKLEDRYNGDLANGLGNLLQRVITLIDKNLDGELIYKTDLINADVALRIEDAFEKYRKNIDNFELHESLAAIWELVSVANSYVDTNKPWETAKSDPDKFLITITNLMTLLFNIARLLKPFIPTTSERIYERLGIKEGEDPLDGYKFIIRKGEPLFPRLQ